MGSSFACWQLIFPNFDAFTRAKIRAFDGWRLLNGI